MNNKELRLHIDDIYFKCVLARLYNLLLFKNAIMNKPKLNK